MQEIYTDQIPIFFSPNYSPPDHNLGQILNSDPARSYFPLQLKFIAEIYLIYFKVCVVFLTVPPHLVNFFPADHLVQIML